MKEILNDNTQAQCNLGDVLPELITNEAKPKDTKIICGFPGVGKSHIFNNPAILGADISVKDSDSSMFTWVILENGTKVRDENFPANYIEHIKEHIGKLDYLFVSTHSNFLSALKSAGIEATIVYPDRSLKETYLQRYYTRGSDQSFINIVETNWDSFIDDMESNKDFNKIVLTDANQHLVDVLK